MASFDALFQNLEVHGWAMADNAMPDGLVTRLLQAGDQAWQANLFQDAHVGTTSQPVRNTAIRGDTIWWLEPDMASDACQQFLAWADVLQQALNRHFFLGLRRAEFHFARYGQGLGYKRHMDQHRGQPYRRISLVLYLNPQWDASSGGELCLYAPGTSGDETQRILPMPGRLVLFRSDLIPHAVLPCTRPRWSLTGWFRNDDVIALPLPGLPSVATTPAHPYSAPVATGAAA